MHPRSTPHGASPPAPDAPEEVKPLDPGRVNTMDPVELRYWCRELHTTEAALMKAVAEVGEHVSAVRERLSAH
jgi:hypothetical protein